MHKINKTKPKTKNSIKYTIQNNPRPLRANVTYTYDVYVSISLKYASGGSNQNYHIDIKDLLLNEYYFSTLASLYQTFKLVYTEIILTPITYNGSEPPIGHMIYVVDENAAPEIQYNSIPETQGSTKISNKGTTIAKFYRSGRQPDTNYWYDTYYTGEGQLQQYIKIRFESPLENEKGYYSGRIRFRVVFKRLKRIQANKTTQEEAINVTSVALAPQETKVEVKTGSLPISNCENKP
jgi:hypothetical protein